MQFSSPGEDVASVRVKIDFTVEGSQYDREAEARLHRARREEQETEQAKKEQQEHEAARQEQLEAEQQARQEQLEREQARQRQLQEQKEAPQPPVNIQPEPKPLPALPEKELDEERLRKFRERMENYQDE